MSERVTGKAKLKVDGMDKTYILSRQEVDNDKIGRLTVRNIMKDLGAGAADPGTVALCLMSIDDPSQKVQIYGDEIIEMARSCVDSGQWPTGIGEVALVALASPAAKETAASGVSKASRRSEYSSHWKICLRWCSDMRELVMKLPQAYRVGSAMAEMADTKMNSMFIIKKHVTALNRVVTKVRRPAAACKTACLSLVTTGCVEVGNSPAIMTL